MANISMSLSDSVAAAVFDGSYQKIYAGAPVDVLLGADYKINSAYYYYSSSSLNGDTLHVKYSDGAQRTFSEINLDNPNANSGTASSSSMILTYPGNLWSLIEEGNLRYSYSLNYNDLTYASLGGDYTKIGMTSKYPSTSEYYDQTYGNYENFIHGNVHVDSSGNFSGTLTKTKFDYEKYLDFSETTGTFEISGNTQSIGSGTSSTILSGTLSSRTNKYVDGSFFDANSLELNIDSSTDISARSLLSNGLGSSNDNISVIVPTVINESFSINSNDGDDSIEVFGGALSITIDSGSGNDKIITDGLSRSINGGSGTDYLHLKDISSANIKINMEGSNTSITTDIGIIDTTGIDRLKLSDISIALDANDKALKTIEFIGTIAPTFQNNLSTRGLILEFLDQGHSLQSLSELAIQLGLTPTEDSGIVDFVISNVAPALAEDSALHDACVQYINATSQSKFLAEVMTLNLNIDLIGLQNNGMEYLPAS